jgi:hypothetical protein
MAAVSTIAMTGATAFPIRGLVAARVTSGKLSFQSKQWLEILYNRNVSDPIKSFDESTLKTFPATFKFLEEQGILTPTVTLDQLRALLSADQHVIVDQIISLKPQDYGVDTPYAGDLEPVPADLVKVSSQRYSERGQQKTLGEKCVPRHIFEAYVRMNDAFMTEHSNRKLLVQSCYRSPAYQIAVFINWLINGYGGGYRQDHASRIAS